MTINLSNIFDRNCRLRTLEMEFQSIKISKFSGGHGAARGGGGGEAEPHGKVWGVQSPMGKWGGGQNPLRLAPSALGQSILTVNYPGRFFIVKTLDITT